MYILRAKQIGLSLSELDQMEEGQILDLIIESGNDLCDEEYSEVATQSDFDSF